jgi:hypothetical protein
MSVILYFNNYLEKKSIQKLCFNEKWKNTENPRVFRFVWLTQSLKNILEKSRLTVILMIFFKEHFITYKKNSSHSTSWSFRTLFLFSRSLGRLIFIA